jgi:hypothetical protein
MVLIYCLSAQFFVAWVVISLIWLWFTLVVAIFYPLIDGGLQQMWAVIKRKRASETGTEQSEIPASGSSTEEVGVITKA